MVFGCFCQEGVFFSNAQRRVLVCRWGSGGRTVFARILLERTLVFAHVRMAVPLRLVAEASHGCRWVALCYWDRWGRRRVGGAVPLGLVGKTSRGWRRAIGIGVA